RSGAGIAIVGDPDQVTNKLDELIDAGVSAFILSGYPHLKECDLFAKMNAETPASINSFNLLVTWSGSPTIAIPAPLRARPTPVHRFCSM
ncbi:MAG: hypothetical protein ACKPAJ_04615, partial [Actinomycetota bacterium]